MKARGAIALAVLAVILAGGVGAVFAMRAEHEKPVAPPAPRIPANARAPDSVRVRVEVLNATKVKGLARRATQHLREAGYDVVAFSGAREMRDTTEVIDRTSHPDWAQRVARALGGPVKITSAPDTSRYVDLTVLLGTNWRPPSEPFHP